jgi:gliding motility-associated-like protein
MRAYSIYNYKLAFFFLFILLSCVVTGQQQPSIVEMEYTSYEQQYNFSCGKATPIDLFRAAKLYVSPEYGYWGDANGVPYNGKASVSETFKERKYTNGNIFTPSVSVADTGMYRFYFYFTSSKEYCGIKNGTRFILNLYIGTYGCLEPTSAGELDNTHRFCYGSRFDMSVKCGGKLFPDPVTISDLLFTCAADLPKWKLNRMMGENSEWVPVDVYSNREMKPEHYLDKGTMKVRVDSSYSTTYYVKIHQSLSGEYTDSINITVYPKSELRIKYDPDIVNEHNREYDIDNKITITVEPTYTVDNVEYKFNAYEFFMNNQSLNKYYLGGDTTLNEIVLSATAFTGVEDFITVIAHDHFNCIVRQEDNVVVRIPYPDVFTPDGDGVNDVFLGGDKFRNREFHLEVFGRWGGRLYYGESGWDGTYQGQKVPPGTYLYVLKLKLEDGSTKTVEGTVTLIRSNK